MQQVQANVFTRDDTFFGICEALGEDFGFNPIIPRIALGVLLVWNPLAAIGGYAVAGVVVGLSRWLAPNPRRMIETDEAAPLLAGDNDAAAAPLAAAA
jgi:phage shock protein C